MEIFEVFYSSILQVFETGVFGLKLFDLGVTLLIIVIAISVRGLFAKFVLNKIKKIVNKTGTKIDDNLFDSLVSPLKFLPIVFAFLFVTLYVEIDSALGIYLQKINKTLATIFVFFLIHQAVDPLSNLFNKVEKLISKALVVWLLKSLKYLVLFLGIVATLDVWGIKIGPVIAGLGLFGVAVALGAQDMFKNLISGILILMERSFTLGDVISIPGHAEGTVEHIGFRSTKIRKFDSTPISIPNYIFAELPIINYTERNHRRISWIIGLEYKASLEQIKDIINAINNYITSNENFIVNENYNCFVRLEKFNDSSIDILVYCFTKTKVWKDYLEVKEQLGFNIKEIVESKNVSFAFPSQSIYIEKN
jgi:MscS family membrane protein